MGYACTIDLNHNVRSAKVVLYANTIEEDHDVKSAKEALYANIVNENQYVGIVTQMDISYISLGAEYIKL